MKALTKSENLKLHKEAQSLMAMYRKELNKSVASMKQDFDAVAEEDAEASMVTSSKAKKALDDYRREKRMSSQTTKKQKYKELRYLLNKASEMLDNLYTAHLEDRRKKRCKQMRDECKKCFDGEMVLKIEDEEFQYRGKPLVVPIPYHECNSCGFDIVSYELSVQCDAIINQAKEQIKSSAELKKMYTDDQQR